MILITLIFSIFLQSMTKLKNKSEKDIFVIKKTIKPTIYKLKLYPDIKNKKMKGTLKLNFKSLSEKNYVILNQNNINIKECKIIDESKNEEDCDQIKYKKKESRVKLKLPFNLKKNKHYTLKLKYSIKLEYSLSGAYLVDDLTFDGSKYSYLVTQFESNGARKAFPCIDEPAVKSKFEISIISHLDYQNVISNMPIKQTTYLGDSMQRYDFQTTPTMSTYLLAFIIGNFDSVETVNKDNLHIRVLTPLKRSEDGRFALETAQKSLDILEDMFGSKYPLPKLDLVSIKGFTAGAMENWGLVTFRETAILYDSNSSNKTKHFIAEVVAHELSHQWFGNLVTMQWWNDLWLNETFATFASYLVVDQMYPEFKWFEDIYRYSMERAVKLDSTQQTHTISTFIQHVEEVDEVFDAISYEKGQAVMRNFYHWIGADNFLRGLRNYLQKHQYNNAKKDDLFAEWDITTKSDFSQKISTWIDQVGIPLISVESNANGIEITQSRFTYLKQSKPAGSVDPIWFIPLFYKDKSGMKLAELTARSTTVKVEGWVHLNCEARSFLRVNYSEKLMNQIMQKEVYDTLNKSERFQLLADSFALFVSGNNSLGYYLNIVSKTLQNADKNSFISILSYVFSNISSIVELAENDQVKQIVYKKIYFYLKPYLKELNIGIVPKDSDAQEAYDSSLYLYITLYKHITKEDRIQQIDDYFLLTSEKILKNTTGINDIDVAHCLTFYVMKFKTTEQLDMYFDFYKRQNSNILKVNIYRSFEHIKSGFKEKVIDFVYKANIQDVSVGLSRLVIDRKGHAIHKKYFYKNMKDIIDNIPSMLMTSVLKLTLVSSIDIEDYNYLLKNLDSESLKTFKKTLKQIEEKILTNKQIHSIIQKNYNSVDYWKKYMEA